MPATATHAFFAEDIYDKLTKQEKSRLKGEQKLFFMFAQHTDPLMFFSIFFPFKGKKIRNLQRIAHTTKTNEFFQNLITYIKEKKYYNDSKTLAFLYGFIAHFCLDSAVHPYVYYKTGHFIRKNKSTYKYLCLHHNMETLIDNTLISNREKKDYTKFNIHNFVFDLKPFSKELNCSIKYTFIKTYNIDHMDIYYYQSLKDMKTFLRLFRKDKTGIKRILYKGLDKIIPPGLFVFDSLSYHQSIEDKNNYLNLNHSIWNYPIDKKITLKKSFYDLYNDSLKECLTIIKEVNQYFFENQKIDIEKRFKNKSLTTGIDCNCKKIPKYFEK